MTSPLASTISLLVDLIFTEKHQFTAIESLIFIYIDIFTTFEFLFHDGSSYFNARVLISKLSNHFRITGSDQISPRT